MIELAPGLALVVDEVRLPEEVLAFEGDGLPPEILTGKVSITTRPDIRRRPRHRNDAEATWGTTARAGARIGDGAARELVPGRVLVGGRVLRAVALLSAMTGEAAGARALITVANPARAKLAIAATVVTDDACVR